MLHPRTSTRQSVLNARSTFGVQLVLIALIGGHRHRCRVRCSGRSCSSRSSTSCRACWPEPAPGVNLAVRRSAHRPHPRWPSGAASSAPWPRPGGACARAASPMTAVSRRRQGAPRPRPSRCSSAAASRGGSAAWSPSTPSPSTCRGGRAASASSGPTAPGKTTLFNLLTGQLKRQRPGRGRSFAGATSPGCPRTSGSRLGLGRTFQIVAARSPTLTVLENVDDGGLPAPAPAAAAAETAAAAVLEPGRSGPRQRRARRRRCTLRRAASGSRWPARMAAGAARCCCSTR